METITEEKLLTRFDNRKIEIVDNNNFTINEKKEIVFTKDRNCHNYVILGTLRISDLISWIEDRNRDGKKVIICRQNGEIVRDGEIMLTAI